MFGMFEGLYAFLTRQIGTRNDSANTTGSLHAKVRSVYNWVITLQRPRGTRKVTYSTSSTTYTTIMTESGSGTIRGIMLDGGGSNGSFSRFVTLEIDGEEIAEYTTV